MANVQQMPSATVVRVVRKQARATCPNIVRTIKTIVHPTSLCRAVKRAVLPKACVMLPRLVTVCHHNVHQTQLNQRRRRAAVVHMARVKNLVIVTV